MNWEVVGRRAAVKEVGLNSSRVGFSALHWWAKGFRPDSHVTLTTAFAHNLSEIYRLQMTSSFLLLIDQILIISRIAFISLFQHGYLYPKHILPILSRTPALTEANILDQTSKVFTVTGGTPSSRQGRSGCDSSSGRLE
jgi:hypothetical protein